MTKLRASTATIRTETVREQVAGKARAHALLAQIIDSLVIYGGRPIKGSHLDHRVKQTQMLDQFFERVREDARNPESTTWKDDQSRRGVEELLANRQRLADAASRILECLAVPDKAWKIKEGDLDLLTEELNRNREPIRFHPEQRAYGRKTRPFTLAVELLEYMNLCVRYGPAHGICARKGCGALMISGRGAKKFCTPECRKAEWAYEHNKPYYKEHRSMARHYKSKGATRQAKANKAASSKK